MKRYLPLLLLLTGLSSCYNDDFETLYPSNAIPCDTSNVTYSQVVGPIFMTNCAAASGCHKSADAAGSAGVALDSYAGAKDAVLNKNVVEAINHISPYSQMPKGGPKLDDCTIRKITIWRDLGAPNN